MKQKNKIDGISKNSDQSDISEHQVIYNTDEKISADRHEQATRVWDAIDEDKAMNTVLQRLRADRRKKHTRRLVISVASAAAVFTAAMVVFMPGGNKEQQLIAENQTEAYQAIRIVGGNGEELLLNEAEASVRIDDSNLVVTKAGEKLIVSSEERAETDNESALQEQQLTLMVPRGREYHLVLPDGTNVWISPETSITFPVRFAGNAREVELRGEAYFDVFHDPDRPFTVKSGEMQLRVLGTIFNISAYDEQQEIVTTLIDGSVSQQFSGNGPELVLRPAQQSRYNKTDGQVSLKEVDIHDYMAYLDEKIIFHDMPLGEILARLGRIFDYKIVVEREELNDVHYHLTVHKKESIDEPLRKLNKTGGFAYEKNGDVIRIY